MCGRPYPNTPECPLCGNGIIENAISQVKMRSLGWVPNPIWLCPYQKEKFGHTHTHIHTYTHTHIHTYTHTHTHTHGEHHGKMKAETGVIQRPRNAKHCQQPPELGRGLEQILPHRLRTNLDLGLLGSRLWDSFCCLSRPFMVICYGRPSRPIKYPRMYFSSGFLYKLYLIIRVSPTYTLLLRSESK